MSLCARTCVCVCMCVYVCVCIDLHIHVHHVQDGTFIHMCWDITIPVHAHVTVCRDGSCRSFIHKSRYVYTYMCKYDFLHGYVCEYVYVCAGIVVATYVCAGFPTQCTTVVATWTL